jgi:hypothetical protein
MLRGRAVLIVGSGQEKVMEEVTVLWGVLGHARTGHAMRFRLYRFEPGMITYLAGAPVGPGTFGKWKRQAMETK